MAYAIRIAPRDGSDDLGNTKIALDKLGGAYVACREFASREHIHIVVWTARKATDVRNAFTNTLGKTGNGVISIKVAKDDKGAMRYACKGDSCHPAPRGNPPDVVWHYGHTVYVTPMEAHEAYWLMSKDIKATPGLSFTTQVEHYMAQNQMAFTLENTTKAVLDMTISKKNQINEYFMVGVIKMVMAKNCRKYKKELYNQLLAKCHGSQAQGYSSDGTPQEEGVSPTRVDSGIEPDD